MSSVKIKHNSPVPTIKDILSYKLSEKIVKAHHFASKAHDGQFRKSGEKHIAHPESVSDIILECIKPEFLTPEIEDIIAAGLLHDTVEDGLLSLETIKEEFGFTVTTLVEGVSKPSSGKNESNRAENLNLGY